MDFQTGYSLILDCPRAAVEAVQSLGRARIRSDTVGETADCLAFRSRYVERRLVHDFADDFLPQLEQLDGERAYRVIVPSTEAATLQCLRLPEDGDLRRRCVIASNAAFEVAFSKGKTLALAAQIGIPAPATRTTSGQQNENEELGFPRVVKPIRSRVFANGELRSLVPAIVGDRDQRNRALERLLRYGEVVEQEYIVGMGVGIELLFDKGEPVWHFAHERVHELPLTGGASSYRRSIAAPLEALNFSLKLLKALNWHGVAMVEFKRRPDGTFVLMEINPRLWGSLALSIDCGVDFPVGLLELARGNELPPQPSYKIGYYTRYLPNDVVWVGANLLANHRQPLLLTRPRGKTFVEYLRPLIAHESWDHFDPRDLGVTVGVLSATAKTIFNRGKRALHHAARTGELARRHRLILQKLKLSGNLAPRVLFLCYGNICRSPFASALAAARIQGADFSSSGFHPRGERCSPAHVCAAAAEIGVSLENHRSSIVSDEELSAADLILLMDGDTFDRLARRDPRVLNRATLLGCFSANGPVEIKDPYDMSLADTRAVFHQIDSAIIGLGEWLSQRTYGRAKVAREQTSVPSASETREIRSAQQ